MLLYVALNSALNNPLLAKWFERLDCRASVIVVWGRPVALRYS